MPLTSMPRAEYDRQSARTNWSRLKLLGRSPAHYRHAMVTGDSGDSPARQKGRCLHIAVFEPDLFKEQVVRYDGRKAGKEWDRFADENEGREILGADAFDTVATQAVAVRNNPMAAPFLSGGKREQTILWEHEAPAIGALEGFTTLMKGRVDFIKRDCIVDLKSARDASPAGFARASAYYEYHAQAALYRDGIAKATGALLPFFFVVVEQVEPFCTQVYRVPDDILELGRQRYQALLNQLHHCQTENDWPGYGSGVMDLELPPWLQGEEEPEEEAVP